MREINDHMKQVMGISKHPKPSFNPKNWNWTAIITWTAITIIAYNIFKAMYNLIF
jgi:hypothetical protein